MKRRCSVFTFDNIDHDAVLPVAGGGAGVVAGVRGRGVLPAHLL